MWWKQNIKNIKNVRLFIYYKGLKPFLKSWTYYFHKGCIEYLFLHKQIEWIKKLLYWDNTLFATVTKTKFSVMVVEWQIIAI